MSKKKKTSEEEDRGDAADAAVLGPEQTQGGVQPADAKPLTEEDHGSYANEVNRQNVKPETASREEQEHLSSEKLTLDEFKAAVLATKSEHAFVALIKAYPEYAKEIRPVVAADADAMKELAASMGTGTRTHEAGGTAEHDPPPAQIEAAEARKGFSAPPAPEDDRTREERGNQGAPQAVRPPYSPSFGETGRSFGEPGSVVRLQGPQRPTVGRIVHVYLAAHSRFTRRRAPIPIGLTGEPEGDPSAPAPNARVLEPLPAMVTHVDEDGFAVEVFGARDRVKENFRFSDFVHDGQSVSGSWCWPPRV